MTSTDTPLSAVSADDELAFTPALDLARMIHTRIISPVELVDLYLRRIERLNPVLGAYLTVAADQALDAAKQAELRVGTDDSPAFLGIPVSIKDLTNTAGIRTTHGSAGYADNVPDVDDVSVVKLKAAGFIVLGKTNTAEFGNAIFTEPAAYPPCRNPWDIARSSGGSSGGAACSTAAGLAPIAHGSDAGGSIRIPSAWCGVVGVKPSRGRVSAAPSAQSLPAVQGPIARTVADAAAMLDAIAGYVTGDAFWAPPPDRPFLTDVTRGPSTLRIGVCSSRPDMDVNPDWSAAVQATGALLADLGHEVTQANPPWTPLDPDHPVIKSRSAYLAAIASDLPAFDLLDPITQAFIEVGGTLSIREALLGDTIAATLSRQLVAFFDDYDVLITPTTARPPALIGELRDVDKPWNSLERALQFCPFTADWNMTGQPAISLPLHVDSFGLPIGIQLVGRPAGESTLFNLAGQLEQALPWLARRPPCG